ncbi:hypothetical protein RJT34_32685 [Clitoria ternatea]|uniref:Uncharacterized protein n=1 Tax=Clitoria ternatea TaxID=43366 RepID=A0AAN9EXX2_CLITE
MGAFEWSWNSSASFLYGGLAPIFGVIGLALLVIACSRRRPLCNCEVNNPKGSPKLDEPNVLALVPSLHEDVKFLYAVGFRVSWKRQQLAAYSCNLS